MQQEMRALESGGRGDEMRGKIVPCAVPCIALSWLIFIIVLPWQFRTVDCGVAMETETLQIEDLNTVL